MELLMQYAAPLTAWTGLTWVLVTAVCVLAAVALAGLVPAGVFLVAREASPWGYIGLGVVAIAALVGLVWSFTQLFEQLAWGYAPALILAVAAVLAFVGAFFSYAAIRSRFGYLSGAAALGSIAPSLLVPAICLIALVSVYLQRLAAFLEISVLGVVVLIGGTIYLLAKR